MDRPEAKWLYITQFLGMQTKADPTKIPLGAHAQGQNTIINDGDRISVRNLGYDLFFEADTLDTSGFPTSRLHKFRLRDGSHILIRARMVSASAAVLEWAAPGSTRWETLGTGYTSDKFGFADANINADLHSYVYFGNAVQDFSRWSGSHAYLTAALNPGDPAIVVGDTSGFAASGNVIIDGTTVAYASLTPTTIVLSAPSAITVAAGRGVAQAVETNSGNPKGNIYHLANNRLSISGVTSNPQAVFKSAYGDYMTFATTLVSSSTAASACIFNLSEGGGPVMAIASDEGGEYIAKSTIIYKATLTDTLYSIVPLKSFDNGKSQTLGVIATGGFFAFRNGVVAITPDRQIFSLTRLEGIDYPQILPISDAIKPTVNNLDFTTAVGIYWRDNVYIACRTIGSSINDTVLVYNYKVGAWESPIVGWNVADWAIYNDGESEELYFADAAGGNVYKVTPAPFDYVYDVVANWRTGQINFGDPAKLKEISDIFIEGYISQNTVLSVSLLLDEDGFTQRYFTTIRGSDTQYIYNSSTYNLFGLKPFGTERFGSNEDLSGKKKFRVYLGKDFKIIPCYNMQLELASDGSNQQWEATVIGIKWKYSDKETKPTLYKAFK